MLKCNKIEMLNSVIIRFFFLASAISYLRCIASGIGGGLVLEKNRKKTNKQNNLKIMYHVMYVQCTYIR